VIVLRLKIPIALLLPMAMLFSIPLTAASTLPNVLNPKIVKSRSFSNVKSSKSRETNSTNQNISSNTLRSTKCQILDRLLLVCTIRSHLLPPLVSEIIIQEVNLKEFSVPWSFFLELPSSPILWVTSLKFWSKLNNLMRSLMMEITWPDSLDCFKDLMETRVLI